MVRLAVTRCPAREAGGGEQNRGIGPACRRKNATVFSRKKKRLESAVFRLKSLLRKAFNRPPSELSQR
jgi:hypothetical protein